MGHNFRHAAGQTLSSIGESTGSSYGETSTKTRATVRDPSMGVRVGPAVMDE
jgi:hypothetical protein